MVADRVVEHGDQQQRRGDHRDDRPHQHRLRVPALGAVGEEEHEHEDRGGDEEQHDPQRIRDHADRAVDAVAARLLARAREVHPVVIGRLLGRRLGCHRLDRAKQRHGPRVERLAFGPVGQGGPLLADHGPPVTDELAAEALAGGWRQELGGLELLAQRQRLGLRAAARLVVAGEGQKDDQAEEDGEPGGQHAEDAGGAVAVLEDAARRRSAPDEQERCDGDARDKRDDRDRQDDAHRRSR